MDLNTFAQLNAAYHNGVYEKKELEPDPFGRPGGKHGGVPAPGSGYDRAWKAIQKKNKEDENKKNTNEEYLDIQEWVEALIDEGYDLDQYSDEELYEAYMGDLQEAKGEGPQAATPGTQLFQQLFRGSKKVRGSKQARQDTAVFQGKGSKSQRRVKNMKEELDLYDLVSEYLVSEGFCDSYEDADVIMANMSEEWRDGILEKFNPSDYKEYHRKNHRDERNPSDEWDAQEKDYQDSRGDIRDPHNQARGVKKRKGLK